MSKKADANLAQARLITASGPNKHRHLDLGHLPQTLILHARIGSQPARPHLLLDLAAKLEHQQYFGAGGCNQPKRIDFELEAD
jgi:hypothetical protein